VLHYNILDLLHTGIWQQEQSRYQTQNLPENANVFTVSAFIYLGSELSLDGEPDFDKKNK